MMDVRSAKLTKYAANAMLATKISFMKEPANSAQRVGADIEKARVGIGSDPRIGYSFIYPGAGQGGSCFPKDVRALIRSADRVQYDARTLTAVEDVNNAQKSILVCGMRKHFRNRLKGLTIALWGLAFKPNTDHVRAAPSLVVIDEVLAAGAAIRAFDPVAMNAAERLYGERTGFSRAADAYTALKGAEPTELQQLRSATVTRLRFRATALRL